MKGSHNLPLFLVSLSLALASGQYHYVSDRKTWSEAQTHCRDKFTDLATIGDSKDMQSLIKLSQDHNVKDTKSWIGLHNSQHDVNSEFDSWSHTIKGCDLFCVVWYVGTWWAVPCNKSFHFYCSSSSSVQEPKSWMEAQSSCLLATKEILKSNGLLVNNTDNAIWVNLHGGKWMWSDGTRPSFTHWQSNMPNICRLNELCTISHNGGWETQSCTEKFPSFCHMKIRKRFVRVQLEMNSATDLNDTEFQKTLLDEIRVKLQEKTPTLTNIKWMQHSDGQVFNKKQDENQQNQKKRSTDEF